MEIQLVFSSNDLINWSGISTWTSNWFFNEIIQMTTQIFSYLFFLDDI